MNFYTLSDGGKPTGSEEDSHMTGSLIIPHNSKVLATVESFKNFTFPNTGDHILDLKWKIAAGKYKGIVVQQKFKVFDKKESVRDRALNMFVRLSKIANIAPTHDGAPTDQDLAQFKGRKVGIMVQQWFYQGKEGNFISELHPADGFQEEIGEMIEPPAEHKQQQQQQNDFTYQQAEQAYGNMVTSQNGNLDQHGFDQDVPFN